MVLFRLTFLQSFSADVLVPGSSTMRGMKGARRREIFRNQRGEKRSTKLGSSRSDEENDEGGERRTRRGMSRTKKERRREKVSLQFGLQHSPCLQNLVSSAPSRCEIRADKLAVSLKETLKYTRGKKQNDARI